MEPTSGDDRKKQFAQSLAGIISLMTYLLLFFFFVGDFITTELIWASIMLGSAVVNLLCEKDILHMKWLVVLSAILLVGDIVVYLVMPQTSFDYNSMAVSQVVASAGTFVRILMIVTYFHEFFDKMTEQIVSLVKSSLGMR